MKAIQGKWEGFYEYGVGYSPPFFGNRVNFSVLSWVIIQHSLAIVLKKNLDFPLRRTLPYEDLLMMILFLLLRFTKIIAGLMKMIN